MSSVRSRCAVTALVVAGAAGVSSAQVLNFDVDGLGSTMPAGTMITNQYAAIGVNISAVNNSSSPNVALLFDSANPTGEDPDLATPGVGNNDRALNNILIIAEDTVDANNDGLVDDPDDERSGGSLIFDLDFIATGVIIRMIDIEETGGTIEFSLSGSGPVSSVAINPTGNNNAVDINVAGLAFDSFSVNLAGSGALGELTIVPAPGSAALLGIAGLCAARRRRA